MKEQGDNLLGSIEWTKYTFMMTMKVPMVVLSRAPQFIHFVTTLPLRDTSKFSTYLNKIDTVSAFSIEMIHTMNPLNMMLMNRHVPDDAIAALPNVKVEVASYSN